MTGPLTAINLAFVNIFNFKGRTTRSEYWWATLFLTLGGLIACAIDFMMVSSLINGTDPAAIYALSPFDFSMTYYSLVSLIPFTSLSVRRLHDIAALFTARQRPRQSLPKVNLCLSMHTNARCRAMQHFLTRTSL